MDLSQRKSVFKEKYADHFYKDLILSTLEKKMIIQNQDGQP